MLLLAPLAPPFPGYSKHNRAVFVFTRTAAFCNTQGHVLFHELFSRPAFVSTKPLLDQLQWRVVL